MQDHNGLKGRSRMRRAISNELFLELLKNIDELPLQPAPQVETKAVDKDLKSQLVDIQAKLNEIADAFTLQRGKVKQTSKEGQVIVSIENAIDEIHDAIKLMKGL